MFLHDISFSLPISNHGNADQTANKSERQFKEKIYLNDFVEE